jgi:phytoene/squalene synthetase
LPKSAKFGVYTAYKYYRNLLNKIAKTEPEEILNKRIRIDDFSKLFIVSKSYIRYQLNMTL